MLGQTETVGLKWDLFLPLGPISSFFQSPEEEPGGQGWAASLPGGPGSTSAAP